MLHAILLGVFKYTRETFFEHMGKTSKLAEDINGLAKMYGTLLRRQSDRSLPNTNFSKGIQKGKLMAKEYRGTRTSDYGNSGPVHKRSQVNGQEDGWREWDDRLVRPGGVASGMGGFPVS